ncbi:MAG: putative bifunctional diguanylate cyclase/phosphodiesterase, partial [Marinobacterium sp.]
LDFVTHYDPLTSLANLTSLKSRIQSLSDPSNQPKNQAFSLIWIDIDRIKTVNDGLGTQAGDQVIVEIGQRLDRLHISGKDLLGRVGGDEFALIIRHQPSADTLALIAATLRDLIAEPLLVDQQPLSVTASIGICCYPENFTDTEELMRGAETAMYTAKQAGTSQFALFNPDHQSSARSRFRLESSLRTAIEQNALDVFYQPIFNRAEDSLDGMEALVRWNHPEHGWMSPIEFLDVARAAGLMYALGACVLRRVCRDWRDSQNLEQWLPVLSVNLSAEQVLTPEFPALVRSICAEYQMPVSALQFEVTEDAIQGDMECVHRVLQDLVDQGARLAIDDFGTGYSSLSRLKNLPVSRIKIDRSFVNGLPNDADDCAITLSIIGLARGLGLSVVAEGVETEAHEHWLLEQGCHYFQGYLYSKPLPLQACRETFLNNLTAIPEQPN